MLQPQKRPPSPTEGGTGKALVSKEDILAKFELFSGGTGGIDSWLTPAQPDEVFQALANIDALPLSRARLTQLLTLAHEAPVSQPFFHYYWLEAPRHPYDVKKVPGYQPDWTRTTQIVSLDQLYWGLYRFYVDALLFFGDIRTAYQTLTSKPEAELRTFFCSATFDTEALTDRGPALELESIAKDSRYLVSEMACKSYEGPAGAPGELQPVLASAFEDHEKRGGGLITIGNLLESRLRKKAYADRRDQFRFSLDELLDEQVSSRAELDEKYERVSLAFGNARTAALKNTGYYLSMVGDLDVYVATSMRRRADFREMADFCESVFADTRLRDLQVRYFDPTLSAATNHEDKGLIECLMVKCAKVLVYHAGQGESYGKDAEAAMALSLGKPVVFHCDQEERQRFYKDVHPLSRLINFETGVAVGAMVAVSPEEVSELLFRTFTNSMEYELQQRRPGYLCLTEKLTGCIVRLRTNDTFLRETFWNHYHQARR